MSTLSIINDFRIQDALDIIFLTFVTYNLYNWFYKTKASKALLGLMGLGAIYSVAQSSGMFLTTWVFQIFWQVLIILLIILFQPEIRQVLEKVNPLYALGWRRNVGHVPWLNSFAETVFSLAHEKIGALILFERNDRMAEFMTGGIPLEGDPNQEIIFSIFNKESPLHDGAMLIRNGRIVMAASFLPLTSQEIISRKLGTRHRSAMGVTERCDAWAIVVSEERGEVSLARGGVLEPIATSSDLENKLKELLLPSQTLPDNGLQKITSWFTHKWPLKLATLAVVSMVWFSFAGQQDFEATLEIPLDLQNLPSRLEVYPPKQAIAVTTRGLRKDISILGPKNVKLELDVSRAEPGSNNYYLSRQHLSLPSDRIEVIRITPTNVMLDFRNKSN